MSMPEDNVANEPAGGSAEGLGVDTTSTESTVTDTPEAEPAPETLKENASETVRRILKESGSIEDKEPAKTEGTLPAKIPGKVVKEAKDLEDPNDKFDPLLVAPQRLSPEAKAVFDKAPKALKREITKTIRDLEAGNTKIVGQYQQGVGQIKTILDAVEPFKADWAKRHVGVAQGVGELAGMYARLSDPKTALQEYVDIGNKLGVNFDHLAQGVKTGNIPAASQPQNGNVDISKHPQFIALQEKLNGVSSTIEQQQIAPLVQQMATVKFEVDPSTGKYRYPELHNKAYLESLSPRVSQLVSTIPGLGHAEALRRANDEQMQRGSPSQQNSTRPLTTNTTQNRAVTAAVTVRGGKSSPSLVGQEGVPPPEAQKSARATTAWVLQHLRNGGA